MFWGYEDVTTDSYGRSRSRGRTRNAFLVWTSIDKDEQLAAGAARCC